MIRVGKLDLYKGMKVPKQRAVAMWHWTGKQRLPGAGVAERRYHMSKVRETPVKEWVLREGIRGQTH